MMQSFSSHSEDVSDSVQREVDLSAAFSSNGHSQKFITLLQLGDQSLAQGQFENAIQYYQQALKQDSTSAEAYQGLAEALSSQGQLEEAAACYRRAIELLTSSPGPGRVTAAPSPSAAPESLHTIEISQLQTLMEAAETASSNHQWQTVMTVCNQLLQLQPSAKAYKMLGNALQASGNVEDAAQTYTQALQLQPDWAEVYANLGSVKAKQQQWQAAIEHYQQAITLKPDFAGAYRNLARIWTQLNQTAQARQCWYQAFTLEPDKASAQEHCDLGNQFLDQGDLTAAIACYRNATQQDPSFAAAYQQLAIALSQAQNSALENRKAGSVATPIPALVTQHAQLQPQSAEHFYQLAEDLSRKGQFRDALTHYQQAIALDSNQPNYYRSLAQALAQLEDWTQVQTCYQHLIQLEPENSQHYLALAEAAQKQGQIEQALQICRQLVTLQPTCWEGHHQLGDLFTQQQQWEAAAIAFQQASELNPQFSWAHNNLGDALLHLNRWQEAAEAFEQAISLKSDFHWSHYNLGEAYFHLAEWEKAVSAYRNALTLNPELPQIQQKLGIALRHQGEAILTEALHCYYQAIAQNPDDVENYHHAIDLAPDDIQLYDGLVNALLKQGDTASAAVFREIARQVEAGVTSDSTDLSQLVEKKKIISAANPGDIAVSQQGNVITFNDIPSKHANQVNPIHQTHRTDYSFSSPFSSELQQKLGNALQHQGETILTQALHCYYHAIEQDPDDVENYHQAIHLSPDDIQLYDGLVNALIKQGDTASAIVFREMANQIRAKTAASTETARLEKKNLISSAHPSEINDGNRKNGASIHPANHTNPTNHALSNFQRSTNRHSSQEHLATAVQVKELLQQGEAYTQQQKISLALACYEQAIAIDPTHAQAQWQLATALHQLNQVDRSIEHYFQSLCLDASQVSATDLCYFGGVLKQRDQIDRAVRCYEWALQKEDKAEIHCHLAEIFKEKEQYEAAAAHYRQAIELEPTWRNYHDWADLLLKLKQWEAAAQAYGQAIQLNAEFSWSHHNLGDALQQLQEWEAAADAYQRAIGLNSDFHWSHYNLGEVYRQQQRWDQAIVAYQQVLRMQPNCIEAEKKLHTVLHQRAKADLELVQDYYQRAIEREPDNPDHFQQAMTLQPENGDLYIGLAKAWLHQQRSEQAKAAYQMALQREPELKKKFPCFEQLVRAVGQSLVQPALLPARADRSALIQLIRSSGLFDSKYYLEQNPQVVQFRLSPIEHYLDQGAWQGCNPNPFFQTAYYLAQNPELRDQHINPLVHYICEGAIDGCEPNPFFDTWFYLGMSPNVAQSGLNPFAHYLRNGMAEGRLAFPIDRILPVLQEETQTAAQHLKLLEMPHFSVSRHPLSLKVGVYCNSQGNYFMAEIADLIAAALNRIGMKAIRLSETDQRPADLDDDIVVAPHEFFYLGEGPEWLKHPNVARSIMVNVEQPHTNWFAKALYALRQARGVLDINVKSAAILEQLGIPTYFLPLGYLADYAAFTATGSLPDLIPLKSLPSHIRQCLPALDAPLASRPIDVHFIGTLTDRREQFFASQAAGLSQFRCFFHIPPVSGPMLQGQDQALTTEAVIGLSRRSKILLNLHREELPYFEWHRIIFHGLWQKTLVVTEPCHSVPGLEAGKHYIECELDDMTAQIDWLLNTSEGQIRAEQVRQAGYQRLQQQFNLSQTMQHVLHLLSQTHGGLV